MSHRFFLPELPRHGTIELPPPEAKHAGVVLRLRPGDTIELFDGRGNQATCTLDVVDRGRATGTLTGDHCHDPAPPAEVTLYVSLPKGDRGRMLVEKATELGVSRIVPLLCQRSVVQPKSATLQRLHRTVIEACKQSGRNRLMEIGIPIRFDELITGSPMQPPAEQVRRWIAHPASDSSPGISAAAAHLIAIGPEGGFTETEFERAVAAGWHPLRLGPHILRIETAAIAAAAIAGRAGSDAP